MRNQFLLVCSMMFTVGFCASSFAAEEPIIIEDLSISELRAEIEKVQNEFFRVFNISNTDDSLDIVCHSYTPTMSHIRQEACEPRFLITARAKNADDWQNQLDELLTPEQLRADAQQDFERLTRAMNEIMGINDYLRELNSVLTMLRERLQELS